ncbi:TonB-dependent receptor [Novosphingobium sp. KACC 22771]|uniref:TonB-dependent receptor n=1 Tax=Novosphingobium sp. KACC 22771 TaxID=3025670 RepID=UPI002365E8F6|nr:TonB-dependent receptor [Novosphingobium sp. KACC 22771]WDF70942.1 TonB-dependent receptor [Novosphingobium sp. KACC 22771]
MKISVLALAAGLLAATTASAAEPAPADQSADTSFSVGETIVVTARGMAGSSSNVITSVDRLGGNVAQSANVNYAWELVGRLPGVLVTNFNQGSTSGKFSFRGFNGEGEINAVKLLIDGIPSNGNDGNMPYIDSVSPLGIAGIEVVRGTADPRYGLHAIAGSANVLTRSGGNYIDAKASAGSFNSYEGQLAAGREKGSFSQNYTIGYRDAQGYRAHGALDRLSLSGKWAYGLSSAVKIGASARYYISHAQEAGYLTGAVAAADPRATNAYNASDGDRRQLGQYALTLDAGLSDNLDFAAKAYVNTMRDDRYVRFSAGGSQQRRVTNEDHYGALAALHWHTAVAGVPVMTEIGGDYQWQDDTSLRYNTANRMVTTQTRDQHFILNIGGAYVQAIIEPAKWLKITPAWRFDSVSGHFANRLTGATAPINDYGTISQPKISVAATPLDGVTLYGNWGKSFQIGVGSGAYLIAPRLTNLAPSINTGWELGLRYTPSDRIETRVAFWQQTASGELKRKLNDPLGDFENIGSTRRRGVDIQISGKPVKSVAAWAAVSIQKATITVADPATPQYVGNEIDHVPHVLWSGGLDYTGVNKLRLSLWANGQSSYWLTTANSAANGGKFGGYQLFNAEAAYQVTRHAEASLSVKNLFNAHPEYVWWDTTAPAQPLHSPGDSRAITVSLRVKY